MSEQYYSETHYVSGEEILAGDRIELCGDPGRIVFVLNKLASLPDFSQEDWAWMKQGFMIETKAYGLMQMMEADPDLKFIERGSSERSEN